MTSLLAAAALGLVLGALTGMPLGVVNIAIVDAAIARRRSFALGIAFGGALADATHALLAFLGIGHLIAAHPEWTRVLAAVAAVIIVGYAVVAWRRASTESAPRDDADTIGHGVATGVALTLPNPGALAAWAAVAASLWPAASVAESLVFAAGVGLGSAAWFAALGRLIARVRRDHPALRYVPRVALVLFVALAAVGVVRAFV